MHHNFCWLLLDFHYRGSAVTIFRVLSDKLHLSVVLPLRSLATPSLVIISLIGSTHPASHLFDPSSSGRCYKSIRTRTNRFRELKLNSCIALKLSFPYFEWLSNCTWRNQTWCWEVLQEYKRQPVGLAIITMSCCAVKRCPDPDNLSSSLWSWRWLLGAYMF